MDRLMEQLAALLTEVQELRRENEALRRERDAALGRRVHAPYAAGPGMVPSAAPAVAATPVAAGAATPIPGTDGGGVSMMRPATPPRADGDIVMDLNSPPPKQDLKRAKPAPGVADHHA